MDSVKPMRRLATSFKTAYPLHHYPAEYYTAVLNHRPWAIIRPRLYARSPPARTEHFAAGYK